MCSMLTLLTEVMLRGCNKQVDVWSGLLLGQREEVHLGQREGMPQMQQTIHVRVWEVPEEFSFKRLFTCMHT